MMSIRSEIERGRGYSTPVPGELDVGALGRSLRRRRGWILGPTLACFALAVGFVSVVKPRYTADAKVLIESGENYFTRLDKSETQIQQLPDDQAIQSQVQLISSRDIAREAIKRLDLKGNAEFDPLAKPLNPLSRLLIVLGLERDPTTTSPEDRILQAYYEKLTVFPVNKSRVITIEFTSTDPDLAARAANTIADIYIDAQSSAKRNSARTAAASLASLIADLRTRAAEAEAKADAFRSQSGLLVGPNNTTITAQQMAEASTQLAQARTAEADAQAKAKLLRDMIRQGRISEVPDVANDALIRRISEERVNLRAEIALQSRTLLPGHPRMQELNAQLRDVDNQLRAAAEKSVRTLENEARIAASRVDNLTAALDVQKKFASTAGADQVQLNTLELQARLLKDQLEFNTGKYQEALARESAASTPADARVISRADPPQVPSFPKKLPIIAIGTLAGLVLSIGILAARELLSGRAFAVDRIEPVPRPVELAPAAAAASLPGGGMAPTAPVVPAAARVSGDEDVVAALLDFRAGRRTGLATRILVTAPAVRSETAASALTLARRLAAQARTIMVEFDRDAPAVKDLPVAATPASEREGSDLPGLTELLSGEATFAEIIHRDSLSRLHVVPIGNGNLPEEGYSGFSLVLGALAETYDFVLMHGPSPDHTLARALSVGADVTVLLLAEGTPESEVEAARTQVEQNGHGPLYTVSASTLAATGVARDAA